MAMRGPIRTLQTIASRVLARDGRHQPVADPPDVAVDVFGRVDFLVADSRSRARILCRLAHPDGRRSTEPSARSTWCCFTSSSSSRCCPLFFLVGIWGGPQRREAAVKFFLYTFAGSIITLTGLALLVMYAIRAQRDRLSLFDPRAGRGARSPPDARLATDRIAVGDFARLRHQGAPCSRSTPGCRWRTSKRRRPAA